MSLTPNFQINYLCRGNRPVLRCISRLKRLFGTSCSGILVPELGGQVVGGILLVKPLDSRLSAIHDVII